MEDLTNLIDFTAFNLALRKINDLQDLNALLFNHDLVGIVSTNWETHRDLRKEGQFWLWMISRFNIQREIKLTDEMKETLFKMRENRFHPEKETVNRIILRNVIIFLQERGYLN